MSENNLQGRQDEELRFSVETGMCWNTQLTKFNFVQNFGFLKCKKSKNERKIANWMEQFLLFDALISIIGNNGRKFSLILQPSILNV